MIRLLIFSTETRIFTARSILEFIDCHNPATQTTKGLKKSFYFNYLIYGGGGGGNRTHVQEYV